MCESTTPSARSTVSFARQQGQSTSNVSAGFFAMAVFYAKSRAEERRWRKNWIYAGAGFSPLAMPGIGRGSGRSVSCGSLVATGGAGGGGAGFSGSGLPSIKSLSSVGIEHFAIEQRLRHAFERVAIGFQNVARARVARS